MISGDERKGHEITFQPVSPKLVPGVGPSCRKDVYVVCIAENIDLLTGDWEDAGISELRCG